MIDKHLYVILTMDCERISRYSPLGGPRNWELSEKAIIGFAEVLEKYRLKGTFFVVPAAAEKHRGLFLRLEKEGFELGLHFHPQSFRNNYQKIERNVGLASFTYEEQLKMLKEARDDWAKIIGRLPRSFRPGCFSANDATFSVLCELGFRQGNVSSPERECMVGKAFWKGAVPFPHHAHPTNRLLEGNLEFYEIPVTVDRDFKRHYIKWPGEIPRELGFGSETGDIHRKTIRKSIRNMLDEEIQVKTIAAFTHNWFNYLDQNSFERRKLESVIGEIWQAEDKFRLKVVPVTIEELHQRIDSKTE